jgi:hypothetical protein
MNELTGVLAALTNEEPLVFRPPANSSSLFPRLESGGP